MANPLKQRLTDRLAALLTQRSEKAAEFSAALAQYDGQIAAIRFLAQNWDSLTVDQALAKLEETGVRLGLES